MDFTLDVKDNSDEQIESFVFWPLPVLEQKLLIL